MKRTLFAIWIVGLAGLVTPVLAQSPSESAQVAELEQRVEELEMEMLQNSAMVAEDECDDLNIIEFQGRSRALQALNPELSAELDAYAVGVYQDGREYSDLMRSGFHLREFALHFQSTLDPFSLMKVGVALSAEGAELEEGYIVYSGIFPRINLSFGMFRQDLGVVNRWHEHSLDQFEYPWMLKIPFGPEGLVQTGISVNWLMPAVWADANELILQVTNGQNEAAFSGELFSIPTTLLRLKSYWDLSKNTYFEFNLTGMVGFNHRRGLSKTDSGLGGLLGVGGVVPSTDTLAPLDEANPLAGNSTNESLRTTYVGGFDMTLNWSPLERTSYKGFLWRTEGLYVRQQFPGLEGGSNPRTMDFWGMYSYVEGLVRRNLSVGLRGDLVRLFRESGGTDEFIWQATPYITWWQSEFVRVRVEYNAISRPDTDLEHRALLQLSFAAGPHKHERY